MPIDAKVMRRVKLDADGHYSIETAAERRNTAVVCDACGISDLCPVYNRRVPKWVKTKVTRCEMFVPVITFVPPIIGLHGEFNTMRLGRNWSLRVVPMKTRVALVNSSNMTVLGYALVERVDVGPFETMLHRFGKENHLVVHSEHQDPIAVVQKVLKGAYGQFLTDYSELTVLSLRRLDAQEFQQDDSGASAAKR